jgi:hypothetical protein
LEHLFHHLTPEATYLEYIEPFTAAIEEGIGKCSTGLVGQFLDKTLPYFLAKTTMKRLWDQYGKVD